MNSKPLVAGERMSRDEFLERWDAMPELKHAELIGGIVYMPSPASLEHAFPHGSVAGWLGYYAVRTPGCKSGMEATWLMMNDAPQPDIFLCVASAFGGQADLEGRLAAGAPELAAEISISSKWHDLGPKKDLYCEAGVKEYIVHLRNAVQWYRLAEGRYILIEPDRDGIIRSSIFPGLWLDAGALLRSDDARVFEVLEQGLRSPEHAAFVASLC